MYVDGEYVASIEWQQNILSQSKCLQLFDFILRNLWLPILWTCKATVLGDKKMIETGNTQFYIFNQLT